MRRTRFTTVLFAALSLGFFGFRNFRVAAQAPLVALLPHTWSAEYGAASRVRQEAEFDKSFDLPRWRLRLLDLGFGRFLERRYTLERYVPPDELLRLASAAQARGEAELPAFAALRLPTTMRSEVLQFADHAVSRQASLTWLYYHLALRFEESWKSTPSPQDLRVAVAKLEAWDPENAVPYLLQASMLKARRPRVATLAPSERGKMIAAMEIDLEWQKTMEAAFDRRGFDNYSDRRFQLERSVLLRQGWTHPIVTALLLRPYAGAGLWSAWEYAGLLLNRIGAHAEKAEDFEKALQNYRKAAAFGERLRLHSRGRREEFVGMMIQRAAYMRLAPALKNAGKDEEAGAADYALQQVMKDLRRENADPLSRTTNLHWALLVVQVCAALVWISLTLAATCLVYVNAKRWIRKGREGPLFEAATIAENYLVILLFAASLSLYVAHLPYDQNFSYYMKTAEPVRDLEALARNSSPVLANLNSTDGDLPLEGISIGYIALVPLAATAAGLAFFFVMHLRARSKPKPPTSAAADA